MSRLENRAKAGYFPTFPEIAQLITMHLVAPIRSAARALDPCAGEGTALAIAAKELGQDGETFGIELDKIRAEKAEKVLDHVLHGSYENVKASADTFGLLWLNPPYDADVTQPGRRLEYAFLKRTTHWLAPNGVLVYIIPDYRISSRIATFLASRFEDVSVYRFPDPHYERFHQCVIFGVKRIREIVDQESTRHIESFAHSPAPSLNPEPPPGEEFDTYSIPPCEPGPFLFHLADVAPEEAVNEARAAGVWTSPEFTDLLDPPTETSVAPLLPLRKGHIAMLLAAGCLGNAVLTKGGTTVVVKGQLQKQALDKSSEEDRSSGITRTIETFIATIEVLELGTGIITLIEENNLRAWFTEWRDALLSYLADHARPLHTGDLTAFSPILSKLSRHRRLPGRATTGLFEAQKHTAVAAARYLTSEGNAAIIQATMGTGKTTMAIAIAEILSSRLSLSNSSGLSNRLSLRRRRAA